MDLAIFKAKTPVLSEACPIGTRNGMARNGRKNCNHDENDNGGDAQQKIGQRIGDVGVFAAQLRSDNDRTRPRKSVKHRAHRPP